MKLKMDYVFSPDGYKSTKTKVLEACAIASYHRMTNIPMINTLLAMMRLNSANLHSNMLIAGFIMDGTTRSYDQ
jgi:hypothetical protein